MGPVSARDHSSGVQATASGDLSLCAPHDTSDIRLLLPGTYHYAPHTTLQISGYCFWGLIITRPIRHFRNIYHYKYDIIPASISFPHPQCKLSTFIIYIFPKDNVHSEHSNTNIQDYTITEINMSTISGA